MAVRCRVEFARSAEGDLTGILARPSSQQIPEVGKRLVAAVVEHAGRLAVFPDSGRVVPEFNTPWLRELEMPPYRIVYRREDTVVTVVQVWRSERLMGSDLDETPDRRIDADKPAV
jgi:plasmid stabilization system protein ParE